jgi:hypothetical protein
MMKPQTPPALATRFAVVAVVGVFFDVFPVNA